MKTFFVGKRDYKQTLALQEIIFNQKIKRQISVLRNEVSLPLLPDVTIMVEHAHPVYTIGRRNTDSDLPKPCDITVVKTRRGGGITYHGPGQLTVYPIANILTLWKKCTTEKVRSPIEWFSHVLESTMMDTAAHYNIPTHTYKTGIWSDAYQDQPHKKLGSIGLQLGSWISMHGISFNVCPQLSYFDRIVMCELPGERATSLKNEFNERGLSVRTPTINEIAVILLKNMAQRLTQPISYDVCSLVDLSEEKEWESTLLSLSGYLTVLS
ncbi:unnamed protein product [Phytomonas sp. Hart1]|nr:unnamed protein product [Phytomonas sp. Hart1]|eukprot:CCW69315.1 unnamed protein product [Phytomonas sp. isolate Hart1]